MVQMAARREETGTQELRPGSSDSWLLVVQLDGGTELVADVGDDLQSARGQLAAVQSGGEGFVSVGDDTAVRARDVAHARLVEAGGRGDAGRRPAWGGDDMTNYDTGRRAQGETNGRSVLDDPRIGYGRRPWSETKPFFLTSEFATFAVSAVAVLIAMAVSDILDARAGWLLVTILAAAYMLSRGIAKAGTGDPNPLERR
jgi:hypothetical protein